MAAVEFGTSFQFHCSGIMVNASDNMCRYIMACRQSFWLFLTCTLLRPFLHLLFLGFVLSHLIACLRDIFHWISVLLNFGKKWKWQCYWHFQLTVSFFTLLALVSPCNHVCIDLHMLYFASMTLMKQMLILVNNSVLWIGFRLFGLKW